MVEEKNVSFLSGYRPSYLSRLLGVPVSAAGCFSLSLLLLSRLCLVLLIAPYSFSAPHHLHRKAVLYYEKTQDHMNQMKVVLFVPQISEFLSNITSMTSVKNQLPSHSSCLTVYNKRPLVPCFLEDAPYPYSLALSNS